MKTYLNKEKIVKRLKEKERLSMWVCLCLTITFIIFALSVVPLYLLEGLRSDFYRGIVFAALAFVSFVCLIESVLELKKKEIDNIKVVKDIVIQKTKREEEDEEEEKTKTFYTAKGENGNEYENALWSTEYKKIKENEEAYFVFSNNEEKAKLIYPCNSFELSPELLENDNSVTSN